MDRLQEIRDRESRATPGPWEAIEGFVFTKSVPISEYSFTQGKVVAFASMKEKNDEFIAHSREDIPYLLDLVDRPTKEQGDCELAAEELSYIISKSAYNRCDYCILKTEPCPSRGLNAECSFEYRGIVEEEG